MESHRNDPDSIPITKLKDEWLDIEAELVSRFNAMRDELAQAEQQVSDPAEAVSRIHLEIDVCLDRLNRIKVELTELRRQD
jgi:hypothetical protein